MSISDKLAELTNEELLDLFESFVRYVHYDPDGSYEDELKGEGFLYSDFAQVRGAVYARMFGPKI